MACLFPPSSVYLVGLADGLKHAQGELVPALFAKPTVGQESKAAEIVPSLLPAGKGFPEMIAALDLFYQDGQNLDIPIPMAARHQRAMFEGRDQKQLDDSLRRLRTLYRMSKELDTMRDRKSTFHCHLTVPLHDNGSIYSIGSHARTPFPSSTNTQVWPV
jgi:hypothetical protein